MASVVLSQVAQQYLAPQIYSIFGEGAGIGASGALWSMSRSIAGIAGSLAGAAIDRALFGSGQKNISGPRLTDLTVQTSTDGAPLPIVYGTVRIAGNVIWSTGLEETATTHDVGGGSGGPGGSYTTYSYKTDVAIALCEGPISAILRIWAGPKLIYDIGETAGLSELLSSNTLYNFRVYRGTETQEPDPLIESIEGANSTPAYKGIAYIVFEDLQLADFGNSLPNFTFEVVKNGSSKFVKSDIYTVDKVYKDVPGVTTNRIYYGDEDGYIGYVTEGTGTGNLGTTTITRSSAIISNNDIVCSTIMSPNVDLRWLRPTTSVGYSSYYSSNDKDVIVYKVEDPNGNNWYLVYTINLGLRVYSQITDNEGGVINIDPTVYSKSTQKLKLAIVKSLDTIYFGEYKVTELANLDINNLPSSADPTLYARPSSYALLQLKDNNGVVASNLIIYQIVQNVANEKLYIITGSNLWNNAIHEIKVDSSGIIVADYLGAQNIYNDTLVFPVYIKKKPYLAALFQGEIQIFSTPNTYTTLPAKDPLINILPGGSASDSAISILSNDIIMIKRVDITDSMFQLILLNTAGSEPEELSTIVNNIFNISNISNYNTDELDNIYVKGYVVAQPMPIRGALEPLMSCFNFDIIEEDNTFLCKKRNLGTIIDSVPSTQIGTKED